jgi:hypothetical protein
MSEERMKNEEYERVMKSVNEDPAEENICEGCT